MFDHPIFGHRLDQLIRRNVFVNHALGRVFPSRCFAKVNDWGTGFPWMSGKTRLTVSFDCDTWRDAEVLPWLIELLGRYRIKGSFAVIGSLVVERPDAYRLLVEAGHEIICHGFHRHTSLSRGGVYISDLFYETLTQVEIDEEVRLGRRAVEVHLGVKPRGFRTPHFGSFQGRTQNEKLYQCLRRHGFSYSSSLLMFNAKCFGCVGKTPSGLWEIPLTSRVGPPMSLVDSWNMVTRDLERRRTPRLEREWNRLLAVGATGAPYYLNVYFDPSQIVGYLPIEQMFASAAALRDRGQMAIGTYSDALMEIAALVRDEDTRD